MRDERRSTILLPRNKAFMLAGLLAALGIITFAFGFAYKAVGPEQLTYFEVWSCAFLLCLAAIAYGTMFEGSEPLPSLRMPGWVTPAVTAATLLASFYFWLPTRIALAAAIATVAACAVLHWLRREQAYAPLLLFIGFILCCYLVIRVPIDRQSADMLPLMADADHFLLAGRDPYAQTYSNLFFYLPVQWLVYLPPVGAGIDPRVVNLACFAFVGWLTLWLVRSGRLASIALLSLCPIILSRSAVEMIVRGQVWPLWALTLGFVATLLSPGIVWPALLLGLLLATQQPTMAIALLFGVWLLFHRGVRPAFWVTIIATGVFALLLAPWLVLHPNLLFELYVGIQRQIAEGHAASPHAINAHWDLLEVSMLDLLQHLGLEAIRPTLQAIVIAGGMLYLAVRRNVSLSAFLCVAGLVYILAISLNIQVFKHYYYPGFLLLAVGIALPRNMAGVGRMQSRSRRTAPQSVYHRTEVDDLARHAMLRALQFCSHTRRS